MFDSFTKWLLLGLAALFFVSTENAYAQIQVASGAVVVISNTQTTSSVTINSGGTLVLSPGVNLTVAGDVSIYGGTLSINQTCSLIVNGSINYKNPTAFPGNLNIGAQSVVTVTGQVNMPASLINNKSSVNINLGATMNVTSGIYANDQSIISATGTLNVQGPISLTFATLNVNGSTISCGGLTLNSNAIVNAQAQTSGSVVNRARLNINGDLNLNSGTLNINNSDVKIPDDAYTGAGSFNINNGSSGSINCTNAGQVFLKGNLTNNTNGFTSGSQPIIIFDGNTQAINGSGNKFYNLSFTGAFRKTLNSPVEVTNVLNLGSSEVYLYGSLLISNPAPGALVRTTGIVNVPNATSPFTRKTNSISNYYFYVGTNLSGVIKDRPVIITPLTSNNGSYTAQFATNPLPYYPPVTAIGNSLIPYSTSAPYAVNIFGDHLLTRSTGSPNVNITLYYDPAESGPFNTIAQAGTNASVWNDISGGNANTAPSLGSLAGVQILGYSLFEQNRSDFLLANNNSVPIPPPCTVLRRKLDGGYYLVGTDNMVHFKFEEEYSISSGISLSYKVYDAKRNDLTTNTNVVPTTTTVSYGYNRFNLSVAGLSQGSYYTLEVYNSKNEKWYLRFKR
jgi:hypothetical protein